MKKYKVDISFIIVFFCFIFSPYQGLYLNLLLIILLHELGHLFFIILFKANITMLKLHALGLFIKLEDPNIFYQDMLIALGGILVNICLIPFLKNDYSKMNYLILIFNLLPIAPLDGSRIFKNIFSRFLPYISALKLELLFSFLFLLGLSILSLGFLDYLIIFNILYLWVILIKRILDLKIEFEAILLKRYLTTYLFSLRYVNFQYNLERKIYKYNNIYTIINNKKVTEKEILSYHFRDRINNYTEALINN